MNPASLIPSSHAHFSNKTPALSCTNQPSSSAASSAGPVPWCIVRRRRSKVFALKFAQIMRFIGGLSKMFFKRAKPACHLCFGDVCETTIKDEIKVSRFLGIDFLGLPRVTRVCRRHLGEVVKQKLRSLQFDSYRMIIFDPVPPIPSDKDEIKKLYFQFCFLDIPKKAEGSGSYRKALAEELDVFARWFDQLEGSCVTCGRTADTVFSLMKLSSTSALAVKMIFGSCLNRQKCPQNPLIYAIPVRSTVFQSP